MGFKELLEDHENTLLNLKKDLVFLVAFEEALIKKTQRKPFIIKNDIIWRMVLQQLDMLVINLGSLGKGMVSPGGFFNMLASDLKELKPINIKAIKPTPARVYALEGDVGPEDEARIQREHQAHKANEIYTAHREALHELFPGTKGREPLKISQQDILDLKTVFDGIVSDIRDDRDNNRAHQYEKNKKNPEALKLTVKKVEERFVKIEKLMNSLKLVFQDSQLMYLDMNTASVEKTASDLIDLILWGSMKLMEFQNGITKRLNEGRTPREYTYGYKLREEHLGDAHRFHEAILAGELDPKEFGCDGIAMRDLCFNELILPSGRARY